MVVKMIVGRFAENFEFDKIEGYEPGWGIGVTYGIKECKVKVKGI